MMTSNEARRIQASPFLLHRDDVCGFVYEVEIGRERSGNLRPARAVCERSLEWARSFLRLALQKLRFGE
jgi:hypothetical protein